MKDRICTDCKSTTTYISRGYAEWRKLGNKFLCKRCAALRYKKTLFGVTFRMYDKMKARVAGKYCSSPELYKGLPICTRQEFYNFAAQSRVLRRLHTLWVASNYIRGLRPTPDRINSDNPGPGYVLSNIRFKSFSDNMRYAVKKRMAKKRAAKREKLK